MARGADPAALVAALVPATPALAARHARRLALYEESPHGSQAGGAARLATLRGMRRFGLTLTEDGRVAAGDRRPQPEPVTTFPLGGVTVEYTRRYSHSTDHFQFTGPGDPPSATALSPTGHHSHFAPSDAVDALGGAETYARKYAAAKSAGREKAFEAAFAEPWPDVKRGRASVPPVTPPPVAAPVAAPPAPPPAGHAARIAAEAAKGKTQGFLF